MTTLSERIRATRKARGVRKTEIERLAHLSSGHLSRIESGERAASVSVIVALAEALDVDVGWLITGRPPRRGWKPPF